MTNKEVVIVMGVRTPFSPFGGVNEEYPKS